MVNYFSIDYSKIDLSEELLTSFAKALAPEIRSFYQSDTGKAYFAKWLKKHPEYDGTSDTASSLSGASLSAQSTVKG